MCGFIAQLVEQRTGNAEVMGSNPVEALICFRLLLSNCLNWKIHCNEHSSLYLQPQFKMNYFIYFTSFNVILDPDLDGRGGNNRKKDSAKLVEDMHLDFDLVDIWRIRNPTASLFTWRQ